MVEKVNNIEESLMLLEPIFHKPVYGNKRSAFEDILHPLFSEVTASGESLKRERVINTLVKRFETCENTFESQFEMSDFSSNPIADNCYLVTYLLKKEGRITRRSTIWKKINAVWKIMYHQGTLVKD